MWKGKRWYDHWAGQWMVTNSTVSLAVALLTALSLRAAHSVAQPITLTFTGYLDFADDLLELDESVFVGAPFSGSFTFDPTGVTDEYPDNPRIGSYLFGQGARMWAQIGNYQFVTNDLGMFITNDLLGQDVYQVANASTFSAAGMQWSDMSIVLSDETRIALQTDALLTTVPDLAAFGTFHGFVLAFPGDELAMRGVLTSLTPEPGSLLLFSIGASVLLGRRRNR